LTPYCIDRREVTVAAYKSCFDADRCERPPFEVFWGGIGKEDKKIWSSACNGDDLARGQHPVNCVSWAMAVHYCEFAGKRLPSEAEWERAARGPDGRRYPWGDDPPDAARVNACGKECAQWGAQSGAALTSMYKTDDGYATTGPAGVFARGRSAYGLFDMAGNVWEWVGDWDAPYAPGAVTDPRGPAAGAKRILRGGAWISAAVTELRATARRSDFPDAKNHAYGFRCARSLVR
jgi:formylglycine-generating enzyme required for sulfatase activity